jgi:hypothetical protein
MICQIIGSGSLRLERQDSLYDFIAKGIRKNWEIFGLLEFVRLEYCSTDVVTDFFNLPSDHFAKSTHQCGRPFAPGSSLLKNREVPSFDEEREREALGWQ